MAKQWMGHGLRRAGVGTGVVLAALMAWAGFQAAVLAQVTDPNAGFSNPDEAHDAFSDNADVGDMLDLIHRANFEGSRSSEEVQQDRRNNILNAAELFRQQQRDRLQQSPPPTTPGVEPSPSP